MQERQAQEPAAAPAPAPPEAPRNLTAEDIFATADIEVVPVDVPEWRGRVHLRVLPADAGLALGEKMKALGDHEHREAMFLLLGATLCTPEGEPLLTTDEHRAALRKRSTKVLVRLQDQAMALQGWPTRQGAESPAKNA